MIDGRNSIDATMPRKRRNTEIVPRIYRQRNQQQQQQQW
jgi:hypothetical protein